MNKSDDRQKESSLQKGLSRRGFLKGSVAAAVGMASAGLLAGCSTETGAPQEPVPQNPAAQNSNAGWLGEPPNIADSDIKQTMEADVVVVGAGVAGLNAARAAAEAGAAVIVVEKASTYQYRSGEYAAIDSKLHKELGGKVDKGAFINESMKQMGYRADMRLWKYWTDHSGEAYDWLLELAPDYKVYGETDLSYDKSGKDINIQALHFNRPAGYDPVKENSPSWPTPLVFVPNQGAMMERVYQRCLEKGVQFVFSSPARKLIRPENQGKVQGVVCQNANGYIKVLAKKGVILATGDYGNNKAMVEHFCPYGLANIPNFFSNKDDEGSPINVGDGHKMAAWIGGKIEDIPHAPMNHSMGGALGTSAYFLANTQGERFVNEDNGGQQMSNALLNQPGGFGWQILDDKWSEQLELMAFTHGSVNHVVPDDEMPELTPDLVWTYGILSFTSRRAIENDKNVLKADTLEELAGKLGLDAAAQSKMLQSLKRYNELCAKGVDEDFYKTSKRLFPLTTAPFYATKYNPGVFLIALGGLQINPETLNVYDANYQAIEGLYAAGNVQGGRFAVDYPVTAPGISHGMCLTFGRLAGMTVAEL